MKQLTKRPILFPGLLLGLLLATGPVALAGGGLLRQDAQMQSKVLGRAVRYAVYLPEGYDTDARSYPVLYLLHGAGDDHTGWSQQGEAKAIADREIGSGRASSMIIIMPDASGTGYMNRADGSANYEQMFFQELIPHVDKTYRTQPTKEFRAIAGLSMGGHGSLLYAMRRPDLFSSCFAMSSAVRTPQDLARAPQNADWQNNSILDLAAAMPDEQKGAVRYWIDCGDDDFLFKGNALLHIAMRENKIPHEYRVRDGGHTWTYWRTSLAQALAWASVSFRRS